MAKPAGVVKNQEKNLIRNKALSAQTLIKKLPLLTLFLLILVVKHLAETGGLWLRITLNRWIG